MENPYKDLEKAKRKAQIEADLVGRTVYVAATRRGYMVLYYKPADNACIRCAVEPAEKPLTGSLPGDDTKNQTADVLSSTVEGSTVFRFAELVLAKRTRLRE
jgi:hypothetical protein